MDEDQWRYAIGEEYGSQQAMHENALWLSAENLATHDKQQQEHQDLPEDLSAAFEVEAHPDPGEAAKKARKK